MSISSASGDEAATTLSPPELDLARPDAELRPTCLSGLSSLSPCFSIVNHGCEAKLRALARAMQRRIERRDGARVQQQAHEFADHDELAPAAAEVRSCLRSICLRVLSIASAGMAEALRERELDVAGRLCLREYPKLPEEAAAPGSAPPQQPAEPPPAEEAPPPPRLGAHCDSTLMTLLWADAPGLQVLEPRRAEALGWRPQHVLGLGLPMMAPLADDADDDGEGGAAAPDPPPLKNEHWAYVEHDWARDPLLLTVGASWLSHELVRERCPARCAALHRVVLPPGVTQRHSLPYLADFVDLPLERDRAEAC
jgi:hypothetical protein